MRRIRDNVILIVDILVDILNGYLLALRVIAPWSIRSRWMSGSAAGSEKRTLVLSLARVEPEKSGARESICILQTLKYAQKIT